MPSPATDPVEVIRALRAADSLLICSHTNPDGDGVGSMLAAYHLLRALGKDRITCALDDPVPRIYRWLPGADRIVDAAGLRPPYDTAVILDASRRARIGAVAQAIGARTRVIVIDHHLDDAPEGDLNFIDPTCAAAGILVADLFTTAGLPLSREAAECAYTALTTDTGSFRFTNTDPRAHRVAADLIAAGIDVAAITARVFDEMTLAKCGLLARAAGRVRLAEDGRVAYTLITARDLAELGAATEDLEGLVNLPRNVRGVEVALLFHELDPATTKVSIRSNGALNSAEAARAFGGGGHAAAAGATLPLGLEAARDVVLACIHAMLEAAP